jgi:membrane protease YdiL (CAAX protease family)
VEIPAKKKNFIIGNPLAEILTVVFCVVAIEWIILPFTKNAFVIAIPIVIILVVVILSHIKRKETPKAVGWNLIDFLETLKLLVIPTLIFCVILVLVGWFAGSLRFQEIWHISFLEKCLKVFIGAMLQQHLIQAFFDRRAEMVWEKGTISIFVVALIFSLLHLPNFWLVIFTFVAGIVWVSVYQKRQNLFALSLSHFVLSLVLSLSISSDVLQGMRVGYNYFGY